MIGARCGPRNTGLNGLVSWVCALRSILSLWRGMRVDQTSECLYLSMGSERGQTGVSSDVCLWSRRAVKA